MRNWLTLERPCGRSLAPLGTAPTCVHPLQGSENNAFLILVFIRTRYLRSFASSGVTDSTDLRDYSRVVGDTEVFPKSAPLVLTMLRSDQSEIAP